MEKDKINTHKAFEYYYLGLNSKEIAKVIRLQLPHHTKLYEYRKLERKKAKTKGQRQ
jgi:ribosome recycling factor